jgi:hypothetical protein
LIETFEEKMIQRISFAMATFALMVASAAGTYKVTIFDKSMLNGKELKPGEYKLEVKDDHTAVLKQGKNVVEVPVKVETTEKKVNTTSVKYVNGAISEIRIGGTTTKLVFEN